MKKQHFLLLALGLMLSGTAFSQRSWLMISDSLVTHSDVILDGYGSAFYRSNSLDNAFLEKLLVGGYIDDAQSQQQFDRMNERLQFGGGYTGGLRFILPSDSAFGLADWGWQGQVQLRGHAEIGADKDLFHLIFDGNAPDYLGEAATMNDTWVDYMEYQKVGFGLWHKPTQSGFMLSVVNGQQFERLNIYDGELFTSESGDSLALVYNGTWLRSDTTVSGLGAGSGIGFAFDGRINIPLKEDKGFVGVSVQDLGLVQWNESTLEYEADSVFSYTGIPLSNIIDDDGDGLPNFEDSLHYTTSQGSLNRWLPGTARAELMHRIKERDFIHASITFRPVRVFNPRLDLGYFYRVSPQAILGATTTIGGYGNVRFGVAYEQWIAERFFVGVNIQDVIGPLPNNGLGMGGSLRLSYRIKGNAASNTTNSK